MKKLLPKILLVLVAFLLFAQYIPNAMAATPSPTGSAADNGLAPEWIEDPEVNFVGKTATRSNDFLNWTLANYDWICVAKTSNNHCDNRNNPLTDFWALVRNIVYAVMLLFVLGTAFVIIITRGQNITIMRFVPRFILIILLVTFSFSLVQFLYTVVDIVQGFFLKPGNQIIQSKDLLYIEFDYKTFTGLRALGSQYDESAFISLLLVKLTAITYYVMVGVLLVRKIILWFFLIVSPIFPLLIFYRPVRNTAKIWVGEFFRWLLYAPLFALFLHGLVVMWREKIPLAFNFTQVGKVAGQDVIYPTAINILLGGPGQAISSSNSVNLPDTFALYVVALIMLWVVILLPFLLLRIFLDYMNSFSFGAVWNNKIAPKASFLHPRNPSGGPTPPPPPPGKVAPTGMARQLPFMSKRSTSIQTDKVATTPVRTTIAMPANVRETNEVLKKVNISVPKMQDIVKYEKSMITNNITEKQQVATFHETLEKIANPNVVTSAIDKQRFSQLRDQLVSEKNHGNPLANSVLSAANITITHKVDIDQQIRDLLHQLANPTIAAPKAREKLTSLKSQLSGAEQTGNDLATTVLSTAEKVSKKEMTPEQEQAAVQEVKEKIEAKKQAGDPVAAQVVDTMQAAQSAQTTQTLPVVNRVQQVSLEDYEEVRKMWVENYETLEPPTTLEGKQLEREEWIRSDVQKINEAINLLASVEPNKVEEGMEMVGNILPFLLMGGFSKSEVVAYLKAKLAAATSILESTSKKRAEDDTLLDRSTSQEEAKTMTLQHERELPTDKAQDRITGQMTSGIRPDEPVMPPNQSEDEKQQ